MNMTAQQQRDDCYIAVSFYLAAAQRAACNHDYHVAAFALVAALDPVNFFGDTLSGYESTFVRKFVHSCIDEVSKMLTSDISTAESYFYEAIKADNFETRPERRAVSKHLN